MFAFNFPPPAAQAETLLREQAETLLQEWEARTQPAPAAYAIQRPALLAGLTKLCAALHPDHDIYVDLEDLRSVLKSATGLGIATAAAGGRNRATYLGRQLLATLGTQRHPAPPAGVPVSSMLLIISSADAELQMDELSEIVETVRHYLGPEMEMIFGHGVAPAADWSGLHTWLLVGYAAEVPAPAPLPRPAVLPSPPPPPDATGRDAAFVAAATLVVLHQQASTSLLQRHLKLGYNRSGRVLSQLAQAGIISPGEGTRADVLIADEAHLQQVLQQLPPLATT